MYLHFENGIYLEGNSEIKQVKKDMEDTLKESYLVQETDIKTRFLSEMWQAILRLIAPMM